MDSAIANRGSRKQATPVCVLLLGPVEFVHPLVLVEPGRLALRLHLLVTRGGIQVSEARGYIGRLMLVVTNKP